MPFHFCFHFQEINSYKKEFVPSSQILSLKSRPVFDVFHYRRKPTASQKLSPFANMAKKHSLPPKTNQTKVINQMLNKRRVSDDNAMIIFLFPLRKPTFGPVKKNASNSYCGISLELPEQINFNERTVQYDHHTVERAFKDQIIYPSNDRS